jgi:hypothetical protein
MKKEVIERFISKYNLAGAADSVLWTVDDELSTKFISDDKSVLGIVSAKDATFDKGEYGIYDTPRLRSLLTPLTDDVQVDVQVASNRAYALDLKDGNKRTATFILSEKSVIPVVPDLKALPSFNLEIPLDSEFLTTFIKAKNALPDVDTFTIIDNHITIGYAVNNTNRFTFEVDVTGTAIDRPISFSARYMKEILVANKEATDGKLKISEKGLAHVTFTIDGFTVDYYLVEIQVP